MSASDDKPAITAEQFMLLQLQLAEVKGQLGAITQLITHQYDSTNQRIADFRTNVEQRMGGMDRRLETLEHNERGTALRVAGIGTLSGGITGAIVAAGLAALKSGVGQQ